MTLVLLSHPLCVFILQVSSSHATTMSQPILHLSGDGQGAQGQDLNAGGQTLQSVQLVNPGTFLIQAQTVSATGQIQWQTFQVTNRSFYMFLKQDCHNIQFSLHGLIAK